MRTERCRLTEWRAKKDDFREYELYDYQTDPKEIMNLAADPKNTALVRQLAAPLEGGWQATQP